MQTSPSSDGTEFEEDECLYSIVYGSSAERLYSIGELSDHILMYQDGVLPIEKRKLFFETIFPLLDGYDHEDILVEMLRVVRSLLDIDRESSELVVSIHGHLTMIRILEHMIDIDASELCVLSLQRVSLEFPRILCHDGVLRALLAPFEFFTSNTRKDIAMCLTNVCKHVPFDSATMNLILEAIPLVIPVLLPQNAPDVIELGILSISSLFDQFLEHHWPLNLFPSKTELIGCLIRVLEEDVSTSRFHIRLPYKALMFKFMSEMFVLASSENPMRCLFSPETPFADVSRFPQVIEKMISNSLQHVNNDSVMISRQVINTLSRSIVEYLPKVGDSSCLAIFPHLPSEIDDLFHPISVARVYSSTSTSTTSTTTTSTNSSPPPSYSRPLYLESHWSQRIKTTPLSSSQHPFASHSVIFVGEDNNEIVDMDDPLCSVFPSFPNKNGIQPRHQHDLDTVDLYWRSIVSVVPSLCVCVNAMRDGRAGDNVGFESGISPLIALSKSIAAICCVEHRQQVSRILSKEIVSVICSCVGGIVELNAPFVRSSISNRRLSLPLCMGILSNLLKRELSFSSEGVVSSCDDDSNLVSELYSSGLAAMLVDLQSRSLGAPLLTGKEGRVDPGWEWFHSIVDSNVSMLSRLLVCVDGRDNSNNSGGDEDMSMIALYSQYRIERLSECGKAIKNWGGKEMLEYKNDLNKFLILWASSSLDEIESSGALDSLSRLIQHTEFPFLSHPNVSWEDKRESPSSILASCPALPSFIAKCKDILERAPEFFLPTLGDFSLEVFNRLSDRIPIRILRDSMETHRVFPLTSSPMMSPHSHPLSFPRDFVMSEGISVSSPLTIITPAMTAAMGGFHVVHSPPPQPAPILPHRPSSSSSSFSTLFPPPSPPTQSRRPRSPSDRAPSPRSRSSSGPPTNNPNRNSIMMNDSPPTPLPPLTPPVPHQHQQSILGVSPCTPLRSLVPQRTPFLQKNDPFNTIPESVRTKALLQYLRSLASRPSSALDSFPPCLLAVSRGDMYSPVPSGSQTPSQYWRMKGEIDSSSIGTGGCNGEVRFSFPQQQQQQQQHGVNDVHYTWCWITRINDWDGGDTERDVIVDVVGGWGTECGVNGKRIVSPFLPSLHTSIAKWASTPVSERSVFHPFAPLFPASKPPSQWSGLPRSVILWDFPSKVMSLWKSMKIVPEGDELPTATTATTPRPTIPIGSNGSFVPRPPRHTDCAFVIRSRLKQGGGGDLKISLSNPHSALLPSIAPLFFWKSPFDKSILNDGNVPPGSSRSRANGLMEGALSRIFAPNSSNKLINIEFGNNGNILSSCPSFCEVSSDVLGRGESDESDEAKVMIQQAQYLNLNRRRKSALDISIGAIHERDNEFPMDEDCENEDDEMEMKLEGESEEEEDDDDTISFSPRLSPKTSPKLAFTSAPIPTPSSTTSTSPFLQLRSIGPGPSPGERFVSPSLLKASRRRSSCLAPPIKSIRLLKRALPVSLRGARTLILKRFFQGYSSSSSSSSNSSTFSSRSTSPLPASIAPTLRFEDPVDDGDESIEGEGSVHNSSVGVRKRRKSSSPLIPSPQSFNLVSLPSPSTLSIPRYRSYDSSPSSFSPVSSGPTSPYSSSSLSGAVGGGGFHTMYFESFYDPISSRLGSNLVSVCDVSVADMIHPLLNVLESCVCCSTPPRLLRPEFPALDALISSSLTIRLNRALQDPACVMMGGVSPWWRGFVYRYPFLLSLESRILLFRRTECGIPRAMHLSGFPASLGSELHVPHLRVRKVVIDRSEMRKRSIEIIIGMGHALEVLQVAYEGEPGTGEGPTAEFYTFVSHLCMERWIGVWRDDDNDEPLEKNANIVHQSLYDDMNTPSQPYSSSKKCQHVNPRFGLFPLPLEPKDPEEEEKRWFFFFLGKFVARALLDGRLVDLPFSLAFWKRVMWGDDCLNMDDFAEVWPDLHPSMKKLSAISERYMGMVDDDYDAYMSSSSSSSSIVGKRNVSEIFEGLRFDGVHLQDLGLNFVVPGCSKLEICEFGSKRAVDLENVGRYCDGVLDSLLGSGVSYAINSFKEGFAHVLDLNCLQMFSVWEINKVLCGVSVGFDFEDVISHMIYSYGYTSSSRVIEDFVTVLCEMDAKSQKMFLMFVTGSPRLPVGGLSSLRPLLTVVRKDVPNNANPDDFLASAATCLNYLKLPEYSDRNILRKKLMVAIYEGQEEFGLS